MPGDITLSRGIRTNLLTLQNHSANLEISQERLATGKRVNSALDDPLNYFQSEGLRRRGKDLSSLLDQMSIGVETLNITIKAIESVIKYVDSATGIIQNAKATTDNIKRNEARLSFEELKNQINQLVQDANFNGKNLLNGGDNLAAYNGSYDLRVSFNETLTTRIDISAVNLRASGTGAAGANINPVVVQVNPPDTLGNFGFPARATATDYDSGAAGDQRMQTDLDYLRSYLSSLQSSASSFGINQTVLKNRQQFTKDAILTLNNGADGLVLADQNEEGAKLLALQTRQQLSTQALSLANQADQAVLRLFN